MIPPGVFFFPLFFVNFDFLGRLGSKRAKNSLKRKNKNYTCHRQYPRNSIEYDRGCWYTDDMIKWWYLQGFFFFLFFKMLIFCVVSEVKAQKTAQNDKNSVCCALYLIIWLSFLVHICKMIISPCIFFFFFFFSIFNFLKNFDFAGGLGGKRAKNCPKWQKILSVTLLISRKHTLYDCYF